VAPAASWTAYLDRAYFESERGELARGLRSLADGRAFFADNRSLRIAEARLALAAGDRARAESLSTELVAADPADAEAGLFLLSLQASRSSPEEYRARLWKLFNRVPASAEVFSALCMSLLAARDWEGAHVAVSQHEAAGGAQDGDLLLVTGLASAMQGDDARAMDAFRKSADLMRNGIARYDLALVLLRAGRVREALAELDAAQDQFERRGELANRDQTLSRIEMLRGSALLLEGNEQAAASALLRAQKRDPRNLRAALLLRKLEGAGQ
jgi:tetratricopeptide (TPR) repeat protein